MKGNKELKFKKLKSKKIWPSVVRFIIYVIVSLAIVAVNALIMMFKVLDTQGYSTYKQLKTTVNNITEDYKKTGDFQTTLNNHFRNPITATNIIVFNSDLKKIASIGAEDMNLDGFDLDDDYFEKFYIKFDLEKSNALIDFSKLEHDAENDSENVFEELIEDDNVVPETELFNVPGRIVVPTFLNGTRFYFLFKTNAIVTLDDILSIAIVSAGLVLATIIPAIFLLISMISNIHTRHMLITALFTDSVTGGKNWLYFEQNANRILSKRKNTENKYSIMDLQLVKYRSFCAFHGAKAGENLLENIQSTITKSLDSGEICAHYAKANFALLVKNSPKESAMKKISRIIETLSTGGEERLIFHVGVFEINYKLQDRKQKSSDISQIYSFASAARAKANDDDHNQFVIFNPDMLSDQIWEHTVESSMQYAIDNEEFKVYIQPKYNPVTNQLAGAEALIRWVSDQHGFVPPGKFIPIFEKNGFITKIDDYMISHVAKFQSELIKNGNKVVPISVNVSRVHFLQPDLAEHICRLVDAYGTPHDVIELELTESAFFDDKNVLLSTVKKLKSYGFDISMDDFGAGYSSLNSLKDLPLDVLKLDADFFRGEYGGDRSKIVISEAITLAKNLDMRIVAEGIEEKEQVDFLAGVGCDMIQGYYFSKPIPAEEYETKYYPRENAEQTEQPDLQA